MSLSADACHPERSQGSRGDTCTSCNGIPRLSLGMTPSLIALGLETIAIRHTYP